MSAIYNLKTLRSVVAVMSFLVYRSCGSSLSPASVRSPGFNFSTTTEPIGTKTHCNDSSKVFAPHKVMGTMAEPGHSLPISPATYITTSPLSSASLPPKDMFLFPPSSTPNATIQQGCVSGGRCCQQQAANEATNLGEFFNAARSRSPLECHFQELTLTGKGAWRRLPYRCDSNGCRRLVPG